MNRLNKNIKNIIIISVLSALVVVGLCACALPWEPTRSLEEEVTDALGEVNPPEEEYIVEPETGLEYVDSDTPAQPQTDTAETTTDASTEEAMDVVPMEVSAADEQGNTESHIQQEAAVEEDTLQIVFIGDSIFDAVRDETGIAYKVGDALDADVYNLAIGGTTAGLRMDKSTNVSTWSDPNFHGILYSMNGSAPADLLDGYKAGEILKTCDFDKTDYFIIEYGTNDFLWYIPLGKTQTTGGYYNYFRGALDIGVEFLKKNYPNAKIIMCTPYYEEYWSADRTRFIGDANTVNNGYGYLFDYVSVIGDVARDYDLSCLNMYELMAVDIYNINDMTVDGIHPSETAREKYAGLLVDEIKRLEENSEEK